MSELFVQILQGWRILVEFCDVLLWGVAEYRHRENPVEDLGQLCTPVWRCQKHDPYD